MLMIMAMRRLSVSYQDWGLSLFLSIGVSLSLCPEDWSCQRTSICSSLWEEGDGLGKVNPADGPALHLLRRAQGCGDVIISMIFA